MSDAGSSSGKSEDAKRSANARGSGGVHENSWADAGRSAGTQDKLGRALSDLLENPLVTGAIGHAWGAREKAAQAQELWMGALNIPSSADIERLTRRMRSVSQRLEGVEDGVQRLGRSLVQGTGIEARLEAIEDGLRALSDELGELRDLVARSTPAQTAAESPGSRGRSGSGTKSRSATRSGSGARSGSGTKASSATRSTRAARSGSGAKASSGARSGSGTRSPATTRSSSRGRSTSKSPSHSAAKPKS